MYIPELTDLQKKLLVCLRDDLQEWGHTYTMLAALERFVPNERHSVQAFIYLQNMVANGLVEESDSNHLDSLPLHRLSGRGRRLREEIIAADPQLLVAYVRAQQDYEAALLSNAEIGVL